MRKLYRIRLYVLQRKLIDKMKHNTRCENANPKSVCRCRCGGKLHGIAHKEDSDTSWIRTVNKKLGGEIEDIIEQIEGKRFLCTCNTKYIINHFLGYDHNGGYKDKDGNRWWVFVECPKCKYQWSIDKLLARIKVLEDWL